MEKSTPTHADVSVPRASEENLSLPMSPWRRILASVQRFFRTNSIVRTLWFGFLLLLLAEIVTSILFVICGLILGNSIAISLLIPVFVISFLSLIWWFRRRRPVEPAKREQETPVPSFWNQKSQNISNVNSGKAASAPAKPDSEEDGWLMVLAKFALFVFMSFLFASGKIDFLRNRNAERLKTESKNHLSSPRITLSPPRLGQDFEVAQKRQRQQATEAYWQAAVASLHAFRFAAIPDEESISAVIQRLPEFQRAINQAKGVSIQNVDPDLLEMSRLHLDWDERQLQLVRQLFQLLPEIAKNGETATAGEASRQFDLFLLALESDPKLLQQFTPQFQELIGELLEGDARSNVQRQEILIKQAVLKERYPGTSFSLPEIDPPN